MLRNATSPSRRGLGIGFIFRYDRLRLQNEHLPAGKQERSAGARKHDDMPRAPLSGELPPSAAEGFDRSSACLLSGLSSPSSATKPPTGRARMLYWVPLRTHLHSTGPMPMENSLTCTPQSFATMKWPNSWMAITALNTNTAAIKVTIKDISSPYRCALTKARAILSHSYTSARV